MPTIEIKWFDGRTAEQKAKLSKVITDAVVDIGKTTPEATHIIFHDIKKSDWAQSGKLVSES
jgi:4-oxalocrotonate tautomerase